MDTTPLNTKEIEAQIIEVLQTCFDPEIPVNIYELGLVYDVKVEPSGEAKVLMTLTSPNCPAAAELPADVEAKVGSVPGVMDAKVEVVWDPPWDQTRMSEAARLQLGLL